MNERTYSWDDPAALAADARGQSGHDFLQGLIDRQAQVPIGVTNGFTLAELGEGRCLFTADPGAWAYNPIGRIHGGWAACVLDAALGVALHTTLPQGQGYTTV